MYKHCNTEESARRQRQIENCLLDLMQTIPYFQITISDICQKAELSRKSFYRYFSSKDGCLHGLIDHCILDAHSAYHADTSNEMSQEKVLETYFSYWKQMHTLLEALYQNQLTNHLLERSLMMVTQEELEFRNVLNSDELDDAFEQTLFIASGMTGLIIHWHLTGYQKTAAQLASTANRLLARNLLSFPIVRQKS